MILVAALALLWPHPNSFSISEIHVRGAKVELHLRCQVLSLGEVVESFDPELDGRAGEGEIEAHAAAIADYVEAHYRFVPGARTSAEAGDATRALQRIEALVVEAPPALDPLNEVSDWVDVRLRFRAPDGPFEQLGVFVDLFEETSPGHRDSTAAVWNGVDLGDEGAWHFALGANRHVFTATEEALARGAPALRRYAALGAREAFAAYDAALLALLLVLAARASRRSALLSSGLFVAAMGLGAALAPHVSLSVRHVRFLELTVPLALAYVALDDLLHRQGRTRVVESLVFGLAAGARSAVHLAPELAREEGTTEPLLGFAAGTIVTLGGALLLLASIVGLATGAEPEAFAPRWVRVPIALACLAVGAWLFVSRL